MPACRAQRSTIGCFFLNGIQPAIFFRNRTRAVFESHAGLARSFTRVKCSGT